MRLLILGGTAFLSSTVAAVALSRQHDVTCLARGSAQEPPAGVKWLRVDRGLGSRAYHEATGSWDCVVDVSWQPKYVREALAALATRAGHWTYVSSLSVYADNDRPHADEFQPLLSALTADVAAVDTYGEAKVACEQLSRDAIADRVHISRAGLIAGRGDPSDRFGYWPARFARHSTDDVLVPDTPDVLTQVIGVTDLALWLVVAAENGLAGTFNACGEPQAFGSVVDDAQRLTGHSGRQIRVDHDWLVEQGVRYWAGVESLPLWLPRDNAGFGSRSNHAALAAGMVLSPIADLMAECLAYERELGLLRERRSGLSPGREAELLEEWHAR